MSKKSSALNSDKEKIYVLDSIAGVCFEASEKFYDKDENLKYRVEPIKGKGSYVIDSHENMIELKGTDLVRGGELNSYLETGDNTSYIESVLERGLRLPDSFKLRDVYTSPYANRTDLGVKFNKINSEIRKLDARIGKIYGEHIDSTKAIKYRVNGLNEIMAKYDIAHDCRVYEKAGKKDSEMSYEKASELVRKEDIEKDKVSEKVKTKLNITALESKLEAVPHHNNVTSVGKSGITTLMIASFAFVTGNFLGLGLAILLGGGSIVGEFFKKYEKVDKDYVNEIKDSIENEKAKLKDIEKKEKADLKDMEAAEKKQNKDLKKAELKNANSKIEKLNNKADEYDKRIEKLSDELKEQKDINEKLKDKISKLENDSKDKTENNSKKDDEASKDGAENKKGNKKTPEGKKKDDPEKSKKDDPEKSKKDDSENKKKDEPEKSKSDEPEKSKEDNPDKTKSDEPEKPKTDESEKPKSDGPEKPKTDTENSKPDAAEKSKNGAEGNKNVETKNSSAGENKPKHKLERVIVKNPKDRSDFKIEGLKNNVNFENMLKDLDADKKFKVEKVSDISEKVVRKPSDIDKSNGNTFEIRIIDISESSRKDSYEPTSVKFSSERNTSFINQVESSDVKLTFNKNILLNRYDRLEGSTPQDKIGKMIMDKDVGKPLEIKSIEVFDPDKNENVVLKKDSAESISLGLIEKIKDAVLDVVGAEYANEILDKFEPFNDNTDSPESKNAIEGKDDKNNGDSNKEDNNSDKKKTENSSKDLDDVFIIPEENSDTPQDETNSDDKNNDGIDASEKPKIDDDDDDDNDPIE